MTDAFLQNLERFRDRHVVADYASTEGLRDCEPMLFDTYVQRGDSVLDLGVGGGRTTGYLARQAGDYVGIDYSDEMIAACRRRFPQYRFLVMDACDMREFEDGSFDTVIFSFNGLAYIYPHDRRLVCLNECRRVLKPGGLFLFSLPNSQSLFARPRRGSTSIGATFAGMVRALYENAARFCQRSASGAFWHGSGYAKLGAHGGLTSFLSTPGLVKAELSGVGFTPLAVFAEEFPKRGSKHVTRWYYYVFKADSQP